ncbi:hypothetical protein D3C75_952860 [compost metagenome]
MAKTTCRCGEVLSNHQIPNDVELIVYTSRQWDNVASLTFVEEIPDPDIDIWQCPKCKRLLYFESGKLCKVYNVEP